MRRQSRTGRIGGLWIVAVAVWILALVALAVLAMTCPNCFKG
jgi:hypothetical protein